MKTTIFSFLIVLLMTAFCHAQGSLQFNRALLLTNALSGNNTLTFIVPTGKVWKVTNLQAVVGYPGNGSCSSVKITLNGILLTSIISSSCGSSTTCTAAGPFFTPAITNTIWLPAAAQIDLVYTNAPSACSSAYINGIEFNLIP